MITTNGQLYQWDTGRLIEVYPVSDYLVSEIHIYNGTTEGAVVLKTWVESGKTFAKIPDLILQSDANLDIFVIMVDNYGSHITEHKNVTVKWRAKPQDYVYTEEELKTWESISKRVDDIEKNVSVEFISGVVAEEVEDYMVNNPIAHSQSDWSQTDETAIDFIKNKPFYQDGETIVPLDEKFIPKDIARISDVEELLGDFDPDTSCVDINLEGAGIDEANPINADTLGGKTFEELMDLCTEGDKFELLESFTFSTGMKVFDRSSEPNGTPYNLKGLKILYTSAVGQTVAYLSLKIFDYVGDKYDDFIMEAMTSCYASNSGQLSTALFQILPIAGQYSVIASSNTWNNQQVVQCPKNNFGVTVPTSTLIKRFRLNLHTYDNMVEGTKIEIWGVRAY